MVTACHSWCHFQNIKSCSFSDPTVVIVEDYPYSWRNTVLVEKKITKRWSHHGRRPWCSRSKFSASLIIFRIIHPLSHSVPSLVGVFCIYHHLSSHLDGNRTVYESITQLSHWCGCFSRNLSNLIQSNHFSILYVSHLSLSIDSIWPSPRVQPIYLPILPGPSIHPSLYASLFLFGLSGFTPLERWRSRGRATPRHCGSCQIPWPTEQSSACKIRHPSIWLSIIYHLSSSSSSSI